MTTVKFSSTEKLKGIQSQLYLLTRQEFTQQEILELSVSIISENLDLIVEKISPGLKKFSEEEIDSIIATSSDWGEGTENASEEINKVLYGL